MSFIIILASLVVWALIFWLLWWGKAQLALGEPFDKVITFVLVIGVLIVIIGTLTGSIAPFPFLARLGL